MAITPISSVEAFKIFVETTRQADGYRDPIGFGICRLDRGQVNPDKILQATFPVVNWKENYGSAAVFLSAADLLRSEGSEVVIDITPAFVEKAKALFSPYWEEAEGEVHKNVQVIKLLDELHQQGKMEGNFSLVVLFEDEKPVTVQGVYLKLYALSLGKAALRSLNLNGAFGLLTNCAWSGNQPIELEWLRQNEIALKMKGEYPKIDFVDKFPRYLQHVIPADNTRILDTAKVRMGAQLASGTTVMPGASYINFNAGTTGVSMVEGRISSSAIVGDGSDVGGGASILGVLSGTNGNPVTIGKNVLLGANSVTGIPLGDGCIVDAGIAVLEGTKFFIPQSELAKIAEVNPDATLDFPQSEGFWVAKGLQLAGLNGLHFRQDSATGRMIVLRSRRDVKLNADLH
ncbi:MAG: tetrahydrodipicolinate N-succinyltransferase N-terminal domain-containing protein [Campylobacterales bacterium]